MTLVKVRPAFSKSLLRDAMMPSQMLSAFDQLFNEGLSKFEQQVFFTPRTDVVEHEKSFELHVTLPGLKKEDITLDIEHDVLTISGERHMKHEEKESKFHSVESYYGKFSRSFSLPETVNKADIEATYADGILKVVLPKTETKASKSSISIK